MGFEVAPEELTPHCLLGYGRPLKIGIQSFKEARTQAARALLCPKASYFPLPEQVVPGEHLIGAFTGEDHLNSMRPNKPRQQEKRSRRSPQERAFGVAHHVWKRVGDVPALDDNLVVFAADVLCHHS